MKHQTLMELIYHYKDFKRIQDEIVSIEKRTDEITEERIRRGGNLDYMREEYNSLWETRDKLESEIDKMRKQLIPEVGIPCTGCWYSDRSKGRIEKVLSPKTIQVKFNGVYSCTKVFTYRRNGHWVQKGTTSADPGVVLILGYEEDSYDPCF